MNDKLLIISKYFKERNERFNCASDTAYGKKFRCHHINHDKNGLTGLDIPSNLKHKLIGKTKKLYTSTKTLRKLLTDNEILIIYYSILEKQGDVR